MSEPPRSGTYFCADTDETIGRLVRNSALAAANTRDGLRRTVVGVDMDEGALGRARTILDQAGRENVRLVHADINAESSEELQRLGPFDAAYCRLFLFHQQDPAATLRRMAALLRPGGHIVAH